MGRDFLDVETLGEPSTNLIELYYSYGYDEARSLPIPEMPGWYRTTFRRVATRQGKFIGGSGWSGKPSTMRQRERLAELYGERCMYCREAFSLAQLTLDHVIPKSAGGTGGIDNLVLACEPCNRAKGDALWPDPRIDWATGDDGVLRVHRIARPQAP